VADPKKTPGLSAESHILLCLQNGGPMSVAELALFANRSESSVRHWLGILRKPERRQIRIKLWEHPVPPSCQYSAVYELGATPDARKPKAKTPQQKCRQYHAKVSALRALDKRVARGTAVPASPWDALLRAA
jgi:hypothetical protein